MSRARRLEESAGITPGALWPSVAVFLSAFAGLALVLSAVVTR